MAKNKTYLPQSVAGLISFYDEKHTQLKLRPDHVLIASAGIGLAILVLRIMVPA